MKWGKGRLTICTSPKATRKRDPKKTKKQEALLLNRDQGKISKQGKGGKGNSSSAANEEGAGGPR